MCNKSALRMEIKPSVASLDSHFVYYCNTVL